jgi:outer membrane protein OmpA-like peptidoglycan-associated protein
MRVLASTISVLVALSMFGCASSPGSDSSSRKLVRVAQTERGVEITSDERILFGTGVSTIGDDGAVFITRVSKILRERSQANVLVEGHTDNVGGVEVNARLSEARAQSVKTALVKAGVPAKRISAKGYGFSKPLAENSTPEGRQINRRTDIVLLGEKIENIGGEGQGDLLAEGFANFVKDPVGTLKEVFAK